MIPAIIYNFYRNNKTIEGLSMEVATTNMRKTNATSIAAPVPQYKLKNRAISQVISSSNVGGSWLCFMNGGLNYQIEHHLFPRINHTHYPKVAPVVRQFCQEKKIPYVHFPTVADNLHSCTEHLFDMGSNVKPKLANFKTTAKMLS